MSRRDEIHIDWENERNAVGAVYNYFDMENEEGEQEGTAEKRRRLFEISRRAIAKGLTKAERDVFLLHAEGLKQAEIAEALGRSKSTVCRQLKSSQRKLKAIMWIVCGDRLN